MRRQAVNTIHATVCAFGATLCLFALLFTTIQPGHAAVIDAWTQRYNGPANGFGQAQAIVVDGNGDVMVTGSSKNGAPAFDDDYFTAKYSGLNGELIWKQRYNGLGNDEDQAQAVAVDHVGNVVVTGFSVGKVGKFDFYTAKYAAADGVLLWERRYNGPTNDNDYATGIAVDSHDNVIVTGYSLNGMSLTGSGRNVDFYTAKCADADGTTLWERRYNIGASDDNRANALAVDGNDNVAVTGISFVGHEYGGQTVKYSATNGLEIWQARYNGAIYDARANAVAVDSSGNVVVAGYSASRNGEHDFYTIKYQTTDGAMLWSQRHNIGEARAVDVDASGNVVVTGNSNGDYYTAKYAATDGTLLWEKRYDGSAHGNDAAQSVKVDKNGNVVVTGISYNGTNTDSYTAKYAAADGMLLWEKRYSGSAVGNGFVSGRNSLALGSNGTVAVAGSSDGDFMTLVYREILPSVSIEIVATDIRLRFTCTPGGSYQIERASSVTGPWQAITSQEASASSFLDYIDTNRPPGSAFYRIVTP